MVIHTGCWFRGSSYITEVLGVPLKLDPGAIWRHLAMFTISSLVCTCFSILKGPSASQPAVIQLCCQGPSWELGFYSSSAFPGALMLNTSMLLNGIGSLIVFYSVKDPLHPCRNGRIFFSSTRNWHLVLQALNSTACLSLRKKKIPFVNNFLSFCPWPFSPCVD